MAWALSVALSGWGFRSVHGRLLEVARFAEAVATGTTSPDRIQRRAPGAIGRLEAALRSLARDLEERKRASEAALEAQRFNVGLGRALEMADDEPAVMEVARRAAHLACPRAEVTVLVADSSYAHLRAAMTTGTAVPCAVRSPGGCPAVRRGRTQVFEQPGAVDRCLHLHEGEHRPVTCVPVSVLGKAVGVITAVPAEGGEVPPAATLESLAHHLTARLGPIRALAVSQAQAATDPLTGLMNRRSFEDALAERERESGACTIAIADLDHFKCLNDTYGHEVGDRALRAFAQVLRSTLRSTDLVARFGGEEFVIALPGPSISDAVDVLDRVRDALARTVNGGSLPAFTCSFGVATPIGDLPDRLRRADDALYQAKRAGRNRVWHEGAVEAA